MSGTNQTVTRLRTSNGRS